jgi:hypothetical protein
MLLCGIWTRRNKLAGNAKRFSVSKYKKAPKKEAFFGLQNSVYAEFIYAKTG